MHGVREVAVVAEGEARVAHRAVDGLGVAPAARPGGRVPVVPDGEVAFERGEASLVEHLGHEAHVLHDGDRLAVADGDPRRLLAAVLQREQAQIGQVSHRLPGGVDAENTARVAETLLHLPTSMPYLCSPSGNFHSWRTRASACGSRVCRGRGRARSRPPWWKSSAGVGIASNCSTGTRYARTCPPASGSRRPIATRTSGGSAGSRRCSPATASWR